MAKAIAVKLGGEASSFAFAKLDREKLYGRKERQVVDADGNRCSSAWLSSDGAALVPSGGLAMLYVNDSFGTVERSELKTVDDDGAEVAVLPSTLGIEQDLKSVTAKEVLDHAIHTVYLLTPESIGPTLSAALAEGKVFACPFTFREDRVRQTMFLLANATGTYALVGAPTGFDFIRRDAPPPVADADGGEESADDLDFSMM